MSYKRRLVFMRVIGIAVGLLLCIGVTALVGVMAIVRVVIPLTVLVGTGVIAFWLNHKYWGHTSKFAFVRGGLAIDIAITCAVWVALVLDPRVTNFAWYYPLVVAPIVGLVSAIFIMVIAPLNSRIREFILGKTPIRLYGRIAKPDNEPEIRQRENI